jgi:hypothetical protein
MVTLPSLAKMRLSEFVVSLEPTTSGFCVVPEMYSVALQGGQRMEATGVIQYAHVVIKDAKCRVKMSDRQGIIWVF